MLRKGHILVFLLLGVSLIAVNSLVYAATDNVTIKVQNVKVVDKGAYNVIFVDLLFTAPNIEMGDWLMIYYTELMLENENGKTYKLDPSECSIPPLNSFQMTGKDGPTKVFSLCYSVEKKFSTFKMIYKPQGKSPSQIGVVNLNAESEKPVERPKDCIRIMTQAEKDANPDRIQDGIMGKMVDGECVTDKSKLDDLKSDSITSQIQKFNIGKFFSDLLEQIKSLFSF